jgi:hypothetical protein
MKYTVSITGYGAEVTAGVPQENELELLCNEEKDIYDILMDFEDRSWHDIDDQYHRWGAAGTFTVTITDESGNQVAKFNSDSLYYSEDDEDELVEFNSIEIDESQPILMCISYEKGEFFSGEFETDDFDIHKFKIQMDDEIGIDECYFGDLVSGVTYDGEEIDNIGGGTDGKSFEIYKNFDLSTIREGKLNKLL